MTRTPLPAMPRPDRRTRTRRGPRLAALLFALGAAAFWSAGAASAHVTVAAPGVVSGAGDAAITVRVPDESDTAGTVGLKLQLPTDHPIAGVLVADKPGWTATIKQRTLATPIKTDDGDISQVVSEIDWTAGVGSAIKPGHFGEFVLIGGKLPDGVSALTFKAIQTYSDGKVVSWIQQAAPGSSAQPDFPAPVLKLPNAAGTAGSPATSVATGSSASASPLSAPAPAKAASNGTATAALVVGIVALLLAAAALVSGLIRGRRPAAG